MPVLDFVHLGSFLLLRGVARLESVLSAWTYLTFAFCTQQRSAPMQLHEHPLVDLHHAVRRGVLAPCYAPLLSQQRWLHQSSPRFNVVPWCQRHIDVTSSRWQWFTSSYRGI